MEMRIDEAGHDQPVPALYHRCIADFAEIAADRGDSLVLDEDVAGERLLAVPAAHGEDQRLADEGLQGTSFPSAPPSRQA
jgi:hypothetical protein